VNPQTTPIRILLVEDSPGDVRLTQEVLRDAKIANDLHVVDDGESAMAFLLQTGEFADIPRPDLVLLDLNLPRKDGREVLLEMSQDEDLRAIPVIVLTTSSAEEDILSSYQLSANAYIPKPIDLDEFIRVVRSIETFWLSIVRLPLL
jgi:two-component system, chemotaxis family, response regulator Rcp1